MYGNFSGKKMNKHLAIFAAVAASLVLVGCSSTKTNQSLEQYKQAYYASPPISSSALIQQVDLAWENMINEPSPINNQIYSFLKNKLAKVQHAELKIAEVSRHFAINWGNTGRGGAAFREPAYIHTLGGIKSEERLPRNRVPVQEVAISDLTVYYSLDNVKPGKGYSHYELSRWERYCNNGKNMDKKDWAFIQKEGVHNMPDQLRVRCHPPK